MATRKTQNTDKPITPGKSSDAALRNVLSRVFVDDKEAFQVIVRTATDETVVVHGTGSAKVGKGCSLYIKVRAEQDVDIPKEPEAEVTE